MDKVSVKGVLVGGIVDVVTSVVLGLPFALYAMLKVDLSHTPNAQASAGSWPGHEITKNPPCRIHPQLHRG